MLEILMVRHGQSVADIEERHEGRADYPLTELGREQAAKAASWIAEKYPPEIMLSSTLRRASETAEAIAKKIGINVLYDEDLMEMNNGVLAGLLRKEAAEKYPIPEGGRKDHEAIEGGESMIEFRARAERFWSKLISAYYEEGINKRICIVSHGGMISMLFRSFLNLPISADVWMGTGDTGVALWRIKGATRLVVYSNCHEHLA